MRKINNKHILNIPIELENSNYIKHLFQ